MSNVAGLQNFLRLIDVAKHQLATVGTRSERLVQAIPLDGVLQTLNNWGVLTCKLLDGGRAKLELLHSDLNKVPVKASVDLAAEKLKYLQAGGQLTQITVAELVRTLLSQLARPA